MPRNLVNRNDAQPIAEEAALGIVGEFSNRLEDTGHDLLRYILSIGILQALAAGEPIDQRRIEIDE